MPHFLMSPPDHFEVAYEINPWMHTDVPVDRDLARAQWDRLVATLQSAGARITVMPSLAGAPDLVFTANAATIADGRVVPARFANEERRPETPHGRHWFDAAGFDVVDLPDDVVHEGAGDALPTPPGHGLIAGWGQRSTLGGVGALARRLHLPVHPVRLVDPRLYHLDLAYCRLDEWHAMVAPHAFDAAGRRVLEEQIPDAVVLDDDEASAFCANSVTVGEVVIMPSCRPSLGRRLEALGFEIEVLDVSEFRKAGGACRCLVLDLEAFVGHRAALGSTVGDLRHDEAA